MMKRILVIASISLLVLLAAVELYVQSDSFAIRLRPLVIQQLKDVLGEDVGIGWVRANFIPLYVEARDIALLDAKGGQAVAVRKVKIYINPLPLILKKVSITSVSLLEPRIFAERSSAGDINLVPLVERIRANLDRMQAHGPSGYSIVVRTITVSQGAITWQDAATPLLASVTGLQASSRVNVAGDSFALALKNAVVSIASPALPAMTGRLSASLRYDSGLIRFDAVDLSSADTKMSLSGTMGLLPEGLLNLRFRARSGPQTINRFAGLLKKLKKESMSRLEASATIEGSINAPLIAGTLLLPAIGYQGVQLKDAALSFSYRNRQLAISGEKWKVVRGARSVVVNNIVAELGYSAQGFDIQRFDIRTDDLSVTLSGRADPQRGFDVVLDAESRDKGQALSLLTTLPIEGGIRATGSLTGPLNAPLFDGSVSARKLSVRGILFDEAFGGLQYRSKKLSLESVDIHQQASRFFFDGSVELGTRDPLFAAKLKVVRADVARVVALFYEPLPLHFPATGEFSFSGTARDFTGSAHLALDSGTAYHEAFTRGAITAQLTRDRIFFSEVTVQKGSGIVSGTGWIGFNGTYQASIQGKGVKLSEVNLIAPAPVDGAFDLSIESGGSFRRPVVTATLDMDEFLLRHAELGGLKAELLIQDGILTGASSVADDRIMLSARMALSRPYAWTADLRLKGERLDPLLLLGKSELRGRLLAAVNGIVTLHGNGVDAASLAGSARFQQLGIMIGDYPIENDGAAVVSIRGDRLSIASLKFKGQGTQLAVTGGARFLKDVDCSFRGTANLSLLRPLFRDLEYSDGAAEVKLTVRDDWENPDVAGELTIRNGEVKIRDIPQRFSSLNGKLTFDRQRMAVDRFTGQIGGGTLTASGNAELEGIGIRDFSTRVVFENVTVKYPEGLTSTLSGDLSYDGNTAEQSLTGDVLIRRARYEKRVEWKSMLVDIGKGLYQRKKTEAGWVGDTQINIRFSGKENILFQNNLAKIPLDVDVFLRGTVNHPQLLGRIEAQQGSVYFRQNEFKILHASVDFVDPSRLNPVLDIQAEIQIREYLVRLAVSGTADRAVVTLLSDPSLPDSDILTLLALGKTGNELKGKEAGVGMSEAASFATGQFQDIFESQARSLTGLDRFQVDPYVSKGDTSVPRVTLGKEIVQDKLYLTYSSNVGATTPEQIFRIEYILNRHFSLVGERNELGNTGADIKYRFEFR